MVAFLYVVLRIQRFLVLHIVSQLSDVFSAHFRQLVARGFETIEIDIFELLLHFFYILFSLFIQLDLKDAR